MSLKPQPIPPIPDETVRIARAAFPKGNVYLQMRDEFGSIYTDDVFVTLYPPDGQPGLSPWRLALVTIMQFAENLTDRQAADAVRARLDWKYALSLDVTDAGFHYSVLSEFRSRLLENEAEQQLLDELLKRFVEHGWLKARSKQRTDSTHIVAAIRELNQLELVGETLRHALNSLAVVVPDWLRSQVPVEWFERYAERFDEFRLPKRETERQMLSETIGQDGYILLELVYQSTTHAWLKEVPAVETLRRVWFQQYWIADGQVKRRKPNNMPPVSEWIRSPYDTQARYGQKREHYWIGYKVHYSEVCHDDLPHVITQVETVPATQQDHHALVPIQADLAAKALLPDQHLVDAGYMSAKRILHSHENHAVDLVGPLHTDPSWQARTEGGFDLSCFTINWEQQVATCPEGHPSQQWYLAQDAQGEPIVKIFFAAHICQSCPARVHCTRAKTSGRTLTLRSPRERHETVQAARTRQQTDEFKALYRQRAGVEGTFSQATRNSGLRRTRYIGMAKTHLQNLAVAAATNILRVTSWLNDVPFAKTKPSRFAALAAA
jgi:transposase